MRHPQLAGHQHRHVFVTYAALDQLASQHARILLRRTLLGILQANPLSKAAHGSSPGVPRSIRSRTGQTTDPIPDGMHLEEKKCAPPPLTFAACCLQTPLKSHFTTMSEKSRSTPRSFLCGSEIHAR